MKTLLREAGAALIMLVALNQTPAWAQLTGLPQNGVLLTGSVANPNIVNNSGKPLLGYVLIFTDTTGFRVSSRIFRTFQLLYAPHQVPNVMPAASSIGMRAEAKVSAPAPVSVVLDSVFFQDGSFVGPDTDQNFAAVAAMLASDQAVCREAVAGHWDKVAAMRDHPVLDGSAQANFADSLLKMRDHFDVMEAAKRIAEIPALRRVK